MMVNIWSENPDIKGGLLPERREETESKLDRSAKAFCAAWSDTDKIVFNKSRGWAMNIEMLKHLYPGAKVIVTVRDLREVFASFEKQNQKNPMLHLGAHSLLDRANNMFSPKGMIGSTLEGVQDILYRQQDVFFLKYEDFVRDPEQMMNRVYCHLDLPEFEHDFDNVVNTATDPDHLYLNKYPHTGSGSVEPRPPAWHKFMAPAIADGIMQGREWYNQRFGYSKPVRKAAPEPQRAPGPGLAALKEQAVANAQ
jgi:hypothetical protein